MNLTRRSLLQGAAATGAALLSPFPALAHSRPRAEGFRFVHITDLHIQPELKASEGVAQAVKKLLSLDPRPDFVVTGGDNVMDLLSVTHARADVQFKLLEEALKPLEMPVHYSVGNHDMFGWASNDAVVRNDPGYGKKMIAERILKGPTYRSFDHKDWHFIVLDSIAPAKEGWHAAIDDAQLQWLKDDLEKTGKEKPIVLFSHVPLVTAFAQYNERSTAGLTDSMIVQNGKEVRDLFKPYAVKAVMQGHTHIVEECVYTGTRFITSGAICGEWWKGPRLGVHPEGFAVCDVSGDKFQWQYVDYGWKAVS